MYARQSIGPVEDGSTALLYDRASPLEVLSLAYDVITGAATWVDVAAKLSEVLDGQRIALFLLNARTEAPDLLASTTPNLKSVPDRFLQVARRHGRRLKQRLPSASLIGNAGSHNHLLATDDLAAWRAPIEPDGAYVAAHLLDANRASYFCLACGPDEAGEKVCPAPGRTVDVLVRHLARAAEIARSLDTASVRLHATSQILDRFSVGIIQLDRNGAVTELNAAALRVAQVHNGLTITTAGVHAVTEADEVRLQKAIADAIASTGDYSQRLSIRRRHGHPGSVVVASIDRPRSSARSDQSCCVLFVTDPDNPYQLEPSVIVELLGLTPAEARVAAAVAMGISLAEVATQLGITINTARTLLTRAMAKTGTNSQIRLVRLILTTLIPLPSDELFSHS